MKGLQAVILFLALVATSGLHAQDRQLGLNQSGGSKRVALIIGNSSYQTSPLKNPVNDSRAMARALVNSGFSVSVHENLGQNEMKRAIRAFGEKLRQGGIGLFYYAGHGVQVKGVNYLVPVDATIESEEEVEYECIDAGLVLAQMESARNELNIVILDACRNNPFARSFRSEVKGLAQMNAPSGTIIAYATAPGSVASDGKEKNGLYTQEFLKVIELPSLTVEEVFKRVRIAVRQQTQGKQTPWESSSLTGDFYFSQGTVRPAVVPAPTLPAATTPTLPAARTPNSGAPDRTDPLATARAILLACKAEDLQTLAELSGIGNKILFAELAAQGTKHPRYASISKRLQIVKTGWDGEVSEVRYFEDSTAKVKFGQREPDTVLVVTLKWEAGAWVFEDINFPSRDSFAAGRKTR